LENLALIYRGMLIFPVYVYIGKIVLAGLAVLKATFFCLFLEIISVRKTNLLKARKEKPRFSISGRII